MPQLNKGGKFVYGFSGRELPSMTEGCSPDAPDLKNHPYSAAGIVGV